MRNQMERINDCSGCHRIICSRADSNAGSATGVKLERDPVAVADDDDDADDADEASVGTDERGRLDSDEQEDGDEDEDERADGLIVADAARALAFLVTVLVDGEGDWLRSGLTERLLAAEAPPCRDGMRK
jgi:hypothetical protein